MTTKRAAIYCRISQDREGAGLGVDRQRKDCEGLAEKLGWQVTAVHTDNDASAYSGKPRPGYRSLLEDLDAGRAGAVLVWHTDRLHRSPRELEEYVDLCERRGVVTQTVKAGELDLATPSGRAVARTLGAWARFEVEHKSDRTRRAQRQAAEAGRWLGGGRPFGWDMRDSGHAILNRPEAREIRRAVDSLLAGASLGSIVDDLNRRGVTSSTGRQWNYTTLRQVLIRPRNAGLSTYGGEIVGASTWPVILTEDTWRAVCALLSDPSRRRSASNRVRWLLAGIALCPCGSTVRSATVSSNRTKGTTRTVYRCRESGLGHVARAAEPVDDYVSEVIGARLSRKDAVDLLVGDEREDVNLLRRDAVALRARLGEAGDMYADGELTRVGLERITSRVQRRLDDVEARMALSAHGSSLSGIVGALEPGEVWRALPVDRKRAVIVALGMTVTLLPSGRRGNQFDDELVQIVWCTP